MFRCFFHTENKLANNSQEQMAVVISSVFQGFLYTYMTVVKISKFLSFIANTDFRAEAVSRPKQTTSQLQNFKISSRELEESKTSSRLIPSLLLAEGFVP